jgi:hypothetical protein
MPIFFEVDTKLNFNIELMIDPLLKEMDLSQLFKNTITIATKIQKQYDVFMKKEGKILGQERTQLIEDLDSLFCFLVILHDRLKKNISIEDIYSNKVNYRVPIYVKFNKFVSQGKLRNDDLFSIENFSRGYEVLILNKIKELLLYYKNTRSTTGNNKSLEGFEELYRTFDEIFYNLIVMRYNLQNCLVDI